MIEGFLGGIVRIGMSRVCGFGKKLCFYFWSFKFVGGGYLLRIAIFFI